LWPRVFILLVNYLWRQSRLQGVTINDVLTESMGCSCLECCIRSTPLLRVVQNEAGARNQPSSRINGGKPVGVWQGEECGISESCLIVDVRTTIVALKRQPRASLAVSHHYPQGCRLRCRPFNKFTAIDVPQSRWLSELVFAAAQRAALHRTYNLTRILGETVIIVT
jgi:hypothetical protein